MLLIVTNKSDLTSDYLIIRLEELNIPFWRLNTEDYLSKYQIELHITNDSLKPSINYFNGRDIEMDNIRGVYFRRPIAPDMSSKIGEAELEFAQRETMEVLRSLWRIINEKLWLNHPKHLWIANNKIDQLKRAVNLGFNIPPTCISTNSDTIRDFYLSFSGNIIAKAVKHGFYKKGKNIQMASTQKIDKDFIDKINHYAKVPMIFQEKIKKKFDIRVTVIGDTVYPTAIYSQEHEETKTDWRVWDKYPDINLKHSKFDLPHRIVHLCLKITQEFNLRFSAIDLVYSVDDKYYFLEMNPNGQWAWIEEKVGFPIRDSIIDCLGLRQS